MNNELVSKICVPNNYGLQLLVLALTFKSRFNKYNLVYYKKMNQN